MPNYQLNIHLFLQLAVILSTCHVLGWLGVRFLGQTQVFMQMVAGLLLGPSGLGLVSPEFESWLFPAKLLVSSAPVSTFTMHPNMIILYGLSQLGLVMYLFEAGLHLDISFLNGRLWSAGLISGAGILTPLAIAGALTPYVSSIVGLTGKNVSQTTAWLFIGSCISITAFPMLARILAEMRLTKTSLGTLALAGGCVDDACAWCLLAVVLARLQGSPRDALLTILGGCLYAILMVTVGRWLLKTFVRVTSSGTLTSETITSILILLVSGAAIADSIGIYAVFGAFVCGAVMPRGAVSESLSLLVGQVATSLLLPMFFVYSGLNTHLDLVRGAALWQVTFSVIAAAILGKGVACTIAARVSGQCWRKAMILGALMNARSYGADPAQHRT